MKYILSIFLGLISLTGFSQTQVDLNNEAQESYKKADKDLDDIYNTILCEYKSNTIFIKSLKASQKIWITFRDAELKVKYPDTDSRHYGTVYPMCVSIYLERLTRERIKTLKEWIDGIEEGYVCIGSVKMKEL
jgi:uncharacterized protein YecT (DUF1311 family)